MDPINTNIACEKVEDIFLLRDSLKGLFLAASQFPKNRETRAIKSAELKVIDEVKELLPEKHHYLIDGPDNCLLYTSPSPRDGLLSRMPSSA